MHLNRSEGWQEMDVAAVTAVVSQTRPDDPVTLAAK